MQLSCNLPRGLTGYISGALLMPVTPSATTGFGLLQPAQLYGNKPRST